MNRNDFQALSDLRARDAKALLDAGHYPGAYYLFGYAIECALKSCIAKRVKEFDFPDKKFANECWVHDIQKLINLAGLKDKLDIAINADATFGANWNLIKDWSEEARYNASVTRRKAEEFFEAGHNPRNGILIWIKTNW